MTDHRRADTDDATCRRMETRTCPPSYNGPCGVRPCARFESDNPGPWLDTSHDKAAPGGIRGLLEHLSINTTGTDITVVGQNGEATDPACPAGAAVERVRERCQAVRARVGPGGMINASQILGLLSPTWPDGNYEGPLPGATLNGPQPAAAEPGPPRTEG